MKMKTILLKYACAVWLLAHLCAALAGCSSAVFKFRRIDVDDVRSIRGQVAQLRKEYPEDKAVFLHREQTIEHMEEFSTGYWSAREINILRYVVFDPNHEPLTTFKRTVARHWELSDVDILVLSPDGREQRFKKGDLIEEKRFGGGRAYKLAYPRVTSGTIIEERVESYCPNPQDANDLFNISIPLRFSYPALKAVAAISYPRKWSLIVKKVAPDRARPISVYGSGDNRVVRAEASNVPPQPGEPYSPYDDEDGDYLRLYVNHARTELMAYYGSRSWERRAYRHLKYVVNNDATFSRLVAKRAREVTRGARTDLEKFKAIVEYAQQEVQGDEEYEEKDFVDVLKTMRGSSWQVVGLAHQMARKIGLDVRYLMIHSAEDGHFDRGFTSPVEPGVAALQVTIDGKAHYGFPTMKWLPVDMFVAWLQGRPAYKVSAGGFDGFVTLPVHKHEDRRVESVVSVNISEEGTLDVHKVVTHHGVSAYGQRKRLADLKASKLQQMLKNDLIGVEGDVTVQAVKIVNLQDIYKPLKKINTFRVENALVMAPGEAFLRSGGLFSSSFQTSRSGKRKGRVRPVVSYSDNMFEEEMAITAPKGWTLKKEPAALGFKNRCGEVSVQVASEAPGRLRVKRGWKLNRFSFPAKEHKVLEAFLDANEHGGVPTLVFETPRARRTARRESGTPPKGSR